MDRFYFKCTYCERPMAAELDNDTYPSAVEQTPCPLCNQTALKVMGRVQRTNIVKDCLKAACDARCTNAVGPKCDCVCNNVNHGSKRLVAYSKVVGKLEVVSKDLLNDNEAYLAKIARLADCKRRVIGLIKATLNLKYGEQLRAIELGWKDRTHVPHEYFQTKYYKYDPIITRLNKIEEYRNVSRKVTELAKLYSEVR